MLSAWVLSLLATAAPPTAPTASGAPYEGKPRVRATLVSDVTQVAPGGTFRLGVQLELLTADLVISAVEGAAGSGQGLLRPFSPRRGGCPA